MLLYDEAGGEMSLHRSSFVCSDIMRGINGRECRVVVGGGGTSNYNLNTLFLRLARSLLARLDASSVCAKIYNRRQTPKRHHT